MTEFSKLCTPAKLYVFLAVISIIVAFFRSVPGSMIFWKVVFACIWAFVLGWLCDKGYKSLSWFLVLFPYVIMLLMIVLAMGAVASNSKKQKSH